MPACHASVVFVVSAEFCQMDKYVKIRKIGEGSFGSAFLVKEKDKDRQMVMKEINMTKVTYVMWINLRLHVLIASGSYF